MAKDFAGQKTIDLMNEVTSSSTITNVPKDAAAVILLRPNSNNLNPEVFWVKRSDKLSFLPGFHAFPGGQIDEGDSSVDVENSPNAATSAIISGAARELFEELGVLIVR